MIIPEKQNIDLEENTILEVKSGILILEAKIKKKEIYSWDNKRRVCNKFGI